MTVPICRRVSPVAHQVVRPQARPAIPLAFVGISFTGLASVVGIACNDGFVTEPTCPTGDCGYTDDGVLDEGYTPTTYSDEGYYCGPGGCNYDTGILDEGWDEGYNDSFDEGYNDSFDEGYYPTTGGYTDSTTLPDTTGTLSTSTTDSDTETDTDTTDATTATGTETDTTSIGT